MSTAAKGSREAWAELMPILQAFVSGQQIQKLDYNSRWVDTDSMYSLMYDGIKTYRIKPADIVDGIWSRGFTYTPSQYKPEDKPQEEGIMTWRGTNMDTPPWPTDSGYTFFAVNFRPSNKASED
jgi:hypothetical protein